MLDFVCFYLVRLSLPSLTILRPALISNSVTSIMDSSESAAAFFIFLCSSEPLYSIFMSHQNTHLINHGKYYFYLF